MSKPTFQHRHYVLIADAIAGLSLQPKTCEYVAEKFAAALAGTNPAFDRERFMAAAMGKPVNGRDKVRP